MDVLFEGGGGKGGGRGLLQNRSQSSEMLVPRLRVPSVSRAPSVASFWHGSRVSRRGPQTESVLSYTLQTRAPGLGFINTV